MNTFDDTVSQPKTFYKTNAARGLEIIDFIKSSKFKS